jgi:hypothetical protein
MMVLSPAVMTAETQMRRPSQAQRADVIDLLLHTQVLTDMLLC